MKNKSAKIVVFISTLLVGFLISNNFNFDGMASSTQLSAKEYQNAIEDKQKLLKQISSLKDGNEEILEKINKYSYDDKKKEKIVEDMTRQLVDYGMLTGLNEVKGPGIVIKVSDGISNGSYDNAYTTWSKIFHDSDMSMLLNEIRAAGAEAISINNYRITPLSAVMCNSAFLRFEDGNQVYAPFFIYAIGNPDNLEEILTQDGSHINRLKLRGLNIEIEKQSEIIMKSANMRNIGSTGEYVEK